MYRQDPKGVVNRQAVLEALTTEGQSLRQISEATNLSDKATSRHLRWLEAEGKAIRTTGAFSKTPHEYVSEKSKALMVLEENRRLVSRAPDLWRLSQSS